MQYEEKHVSICKAYFVEIDTGFGCLPGSGRQPCSDDITCLLQSFPLTRQQRLKSCAPLVWHQCPQAWRVEKCTKSPTQESCKLQIPKILRAVRLFGTTKSVHGARHCLNLLLLQLIPKGEAKSEFALQLVLYVFQVEGP